MLFRKRRPKEESRIRDRILREMYGWTADKGFCRNYPSYESIAQEMDISVEQLGWFCQQSLGTSFRSLRKRQRVAYAAFLMRWNVDMPASSAGQEAGISDKSDFRRQFTEVMRMAPEDWRALSG